MEGGGGTKYTRAAMKITYKSAQLRQKAVLPWLCHAFQDLLFQTPMVKRLSCLPSKQAAGVRLPFGVLILFILFWGAAVAVQIAQIP